MWAMCVCSCVLCLAEQSTWRSSLRYYRSRGVMKSVEVWSSLGGCDLWRAASSRRHRHARLFVHRLWICGCIKVAFLPTAEVEQRAADSSWMIHCCSAGWRGLHSLPLRWWLLLRFPLTYVLSLHLPHPAPSLPLFVVFFSLPLRLCHLHFHLPAASPLQAPSRRWSMISGGWFGRRIASVLSCSPSWWKWAGYVSLTSDIDLGVWTALKCLTFIYLK